MSKLELDHTEDIAHIYKQTYEKLQGVKVVWKSDILRGAIQIDCDDGCNGTGIWDLYGEKLQCVGCKGTGKIWCSI